MEDVRDLKESAARRHARGGQHRRRPRGDRAVADDQPHDHDHRARVNVRPLEDACDLVGSAATRSSPRS